MSDATLELSAFVRALRAAGVLSALDEQLARMLTRMVGERDVRVLAAVALLSRHVSAGHVCLPLEELSSPETLFGSELDEDAAEGSDGNTLLPTAAALVAAWPRAAEWSASLQASALCGTAGEGVTPLVLDGAGRLYLRRHFDCERRLAALLRARAVRSVPADHTRVARRLVHYFGDAPRDLQRSAAELATERALCVISGGPGTGKTSTVVKILAVAVEDALASGEVAPRIGLTAPTGKAAVRLQTAVGEAKTRLDCDARVRAAIPEEASTIHRMLAQRARGRGTEPGAGNDPLPFDLLLVDEASMVDLELMTALISALPEHARIILLGDRDQLASVEAGAVLGDICGVRERSEQSTLARCIVQLTRSYRYAESSGIGRLARAVQAGDADAALAVLDDPAYPDVQLCEADVLLEPKGSFARGVLAGFGAYLEARSDPERALRAFDGFRVLCAHRQGERGVAGLNRAVARLLQAAGWLDASEGHFLGRPILITENDYRTRLWNGDIGLVLDGGACFIDTDGSLRRLGLGRLPPHDSAFALSVHKSQGSEVDEVSLVLPTEPSRILSRELVYTALTRARKRVVIHGPRSVLQSAIEQVVARSTGLRELLADA
ncbi:MAG: exodeoxyribonuclease V subunit alpha [Polyangiales bacterium]